MIPARNNYWLLDSVAAPKGQFGNGWQIATTDIGVHFTPPPDGDITLDPLPGKATFLNSLADCFRCPVALAGGANGRVFVMDGSLDRITVLDLSAPAARRITALGGSGAELRHFKTPRSITVLHSGAIAVADTGNRRIQLFSGPPYALLKVWGQPDNCLKPCALASDHCGIIYVVDGESRSVLRVHASGRWLDPIGAGVLQDPIELAVAADQTVAVVDGRGAKASIVIFPADGGKATRLTLVAAPMCLTFDPSGNLYAGTSSAVVSKIQPDPTQLSGWSLGGEGVSDTDGSITKLAWVQGQGLIGILNSPTPGVTPRLFSMDPAGTFRLTGSFVTNALDSHIESCSWHRIQVNGSIPEGASITISSSTQEAQTPWTTPFVPCAVLNGNKVESLIQKDCLVQSPPGRYLRITFTLRSTGGVTPQIHSIQVFFPRQSYLQYLPAVFQDDDQSRLFLDRFLSIFQTTFDDCDALLDNLWQLFDPNLTPANLLTWLAAWVALPVDPGSATPLRKRLKNAFQTYLSRGTVAGLQQAIQDYSGVSDIRILEHFRLRNWTFLSVPADLNTALPEPAGLNQGARLWSPNFYSRLQVGLSSTVGSFQLTNAPIPEAEPYTWGANQFSVLFPADPSTVSNTTKSVQTVLDREKLAHTQAFLCPIFPRLRVGVQATLGVDAYVGKANAMVLGKLATLTYDSVLAPSQRERDLRALGLSPYPRLGNDARIL